MENLNYGHADTLFEALMDQNATLPQLKHALETAGRWPDTVASLQTVVQAKRVAVLLFAALYFEPMCIEHLNRGTAPDVATMAPIVRKIAGSSHFSDDVRRLMHVLLAEPMPPNRTLTSKIEDHRGKVKIPHGIETVNELKMWMQQNGVFDGVVGNVPKCLKFTNLEGTVLHNNLGENEYIYCSKRFAQVLPRLRATAWSQFAKILTFGLYSVFRAFIIGALIFDANNWQRDAAVLIFMINNVGCERLFELWVGCSAIGNKTPFLLGLFSIIISYASIFFTSWPCVLMASFAAVLCFIGFIYTVRFAYGTRMPPNRRRH